MKMYFSEKISILTSMKKIIILTSVFLSVCIWSGITSGAQLSQKFKIWDREYSYFDAYSIIEREIEKLWHETALEKYEYFSKLKKLAYQQYLQTNKKLYKDLSQVLEIWKISYGYELQNTLQKIKIWESTEGREIFGYFKWLPEDGYRLILWGIHGSYEYAAYETAVIIRDELENSDASWYFIVPNLNPDGMQAYFENAVQQSFYLQGRGNAHGIDLNRNFCSKNFILTDFEKFWMPLRTGIWGCESEIETQNITRLLERFYFHSIITLHSRGKILYIPDNSIDDQSVIALGKKILEILPDYDFYPDTSTDEKRQKSIVRYEMDEWGIELFTGTLESYVYETYGIPIILVELAEHGVQEERLRKIIR